jgi:hypothetical protein
MDTSQYEQIRTIRREIATTIATVQTGERAELWDAIDQLDAWLARHARFAADATRNA